MKLTKEIIREKEVLEKAIRMAIIGFRHKVGNCDVSVCAESQIVCHSDNTKEVIGTKVDINVKL